jgi:hypothetical protein
LVALDPSASRYQLSDHASALVQRRRCWRVDRRYEATGTANEADVRAVVEEARAFVDRWVRELWCDGMLRPEVLQ